MIEYVEIREPDARELIGIVDTAQSVIWHSLYYGCGDFEVYAPCTPQNFALLVRGNYVTRPDKWDAGIIEQVQITFEPSAGRMIIASGRMAKSLLDRRVIYSLSGHSVSPTMLSGRVEEAVRNLVSANAIHCPFDVSRNMVELLLAADSGSTAVIKGTSGEDADKQVTYRNLMQYTDELLQEYGMGAVCELEPYYNIAYRIYSGSDRSMNNTAGNEPVIFSQEFDNLSASEYAVNDAAEKNTVLIGGEGEGTARFCTIVKSTATGSARREMFLDASNSSRTYKVNDAEYTLSDAEYEQQLQTLGMQERTLYQIEETFSGGVELSASPYKFGRDFFLGDIVTVQDTGIALYYNPRIVDVTEVQDGNGYQVNVVFGT